MAVYNNLDKVEYILDVVIASEAFSSQNGLLTNTLKLKRQIIKNKYKGEIEELFRKISNGNEQ